MDLFFEASASIKLVHLTYVILRFCLAFGLLTPGGFEGRCAGVAYRSQRYQPCAPTVRVQCLSFSTEGAIA